MRVLRLNQKDLGMMLKAGREGRGERGAVPETGDPGGRGGGGETEQCGGIQVEVFSQGNRGAGQRQGVTAVSS